MRRGLGLIVGGSRELAGTPDPAETRVRKVRGGGEGRAATANLRPPGGGRERWERGSLRAADMTVPRTAVGRGGGGQWRGPPALSYGSCGRRAHVGRRSVVLPFKPSSTGSGREREQHIHPSQ